MKTQIYLIQPFTNMHVGSGKENSGIVDNTVQRDVLTEYPVINSTSLKGAIRECFKNKDTNDEKIELIFGVGNKKMDGKEEKDSKVVNRPGSFNFFNANLLSIPARSDKFPYLNVTTPAILKNLIKQIELLSFNNSIIPLRHNEVLKKLSEIACDSKALCFEESLNDSVVEFYSIKTVFCHDTGISVDDLKIIKKWLGDRPVLMEEKTFKEKISEKLPVIARNNLNNGQSTNLWYEEIVPRETRFYTFISAPQDKWRDKIQFGISSIQIGANASVGYGYCKMFSIIEE